MQATLFAFGVQSKETSGSRQSSSACPAGVPDVVDVEDGSEREEPTEADAAEQRAVTEATSENLVGEGVAVTAASSQSATPTTSSSCSADRCSRGWQTNHVRRRSYGLLLPRPEARSAALARPGSTASHGLVTARRGT